MDENTILGSTYNGEFEDVKLLNDLLVEKNKETGWDTPIHVDAASGGFIAPFLYPELEWDFRLIPLVTSIYVSGGCLRWNWEVYDSVKGYKGVPVVAFCLKDRSRRDEFEVSEMLRRFRWIVPAYPMSEGAKQMSVL
ncbi:unnamed protein product [Citrullus colocynthis]|uniref:glutamate decarboxylase n=1 Tax=Citrullus colocynthis TaxID=252529 RepID=A0ABP0XXG4_9ROSI